jgi:AraC-like DNA-binding protein
VLTCCWSAAFDGPHLLVPDGSMDIVWIEGRGLHLCGPDTRSWHVALPPTTGCLGIRFHPGAAARLLGVDADQVVDQRLPLDAVLPSRLVRVVDDQIAAAAPGARRAARLERLAVELERRAAQRRLGEADRAVHAAIASLRVRDERVDALARRVDLSPRQLQRRFVRHVGYPPSQYGRIARLQRFLERSIERPDASLADLAASAGYADQSHLARDCRAIAGLTPADMRSSAAATSHASPDDVRSVQSSAPVRARASAA